MRRPSTLKNKRYLAGPYLFWSISFVVIPLLVVFYYAMTNDEGSITFANLAQITTQENLKALGMSLLLSFVSTAICLLLAYPLAMILSSKNVNQSSFIVLIFILPMWMNFLLRTMAWQTLLEKKRCDQQHPFFCASPGTGDHQHSLGDHSWHGLQFSAFYGAADLQCTDQDRP